VFPVRTSGYESFGKHGLREWLAGLRTKPLCIEPGSAWENGYCESFNSQVRDECLNGEIFYSLSLEPKFTPGTLPK
jgi:transposase InsO family protein